MSERRWRSGFSLLELAVALVVIGLISAMGAGMLRSTLESVHSGTTDQKLNAIETVLMAYRTTYNRLPCPADPRLVPTDTNYGVEAASVTGGCTGGTPAAPFADSTHSVVEGAVPFKTLGIPESFMYDGWNRKFAYAVNQNVTAANAMQSEALNDQCGISVTDAGGVAGNRTSGAVYALVSFGPDGHGGYLRDGSRMSAGVTNADEDTNCHCDANGNGTAYAASYVEKDISLDASDASHPFQDLVRFKERWQMMTTDDRYLTGGSPVCSYGFRVDGYAASQKTGGRIAVGDVNGDGIADLVIGVPAITTTFVVFGSKIGFSNPLPLNSLNGVNGFTITATYPLSDAIIADVNGDGVGDIIIGEGGGVKVIFGHTGSWGATLNGNYPNASLYDGSHGFYLSSPSAPAAGRIAYSTLGAGDINGDHIADIITDDSPNTRLYVVFGHGGPWTASAKIDSYADGTHGFYLNDRANEGYQYQPVAVGDVNGDGVGDLLIGSWNTWHGVDVTFGHGGPWSAINGGTLGALPATQGAYFYENDGNGEIGNTIAMGDVNGDGTPKILMGSFTGNYGSLFRAGAVLIVPVGAGFWGSAGYEVTTLVGQGKAFWIAAGHTGSSFGGGEDTANGGLAVGDFNGDGIKDMAIACDDCAADSPDGSVYVVYGKRGPLSNLDLAVTPLDGGNGFRIDCSYAADAGYCGGGWGGGAVIADDLNGDGIPDLIVSNPYGTDASGDLQAGYAYVVYGSRQAGHFSNSLSLVRIK